MDEVKERLSGVFAPMTTPFQNDEIDFDGFINNVTKLNKSGLRGYFVLGTNGEYKSLSVPERIQVLQTVVKHRSKDKIVMAGTGMESTKETIEMSVKAAEIGADLVSLLMPHFFTKRIDDEVLTNYVLDVAEASPVPVLLYNNPSVAAGVLISPEIVKEVSEHSNVVGIKDSSKGNFQKYIEASHDNFYVLAGSATFFLDVLIAGGIGGVLSLANVFPDACVQLYGVFKEGDFKKAKSLSEELVSLNKEVSGKYGVAGVKAVMDLSGYSGGAPRRPIKQLNDQQKQQLKKVLMEKGFI